MISKKSKRDDLKRFKNLGVKYCTKIVLLLLLLLLLLYSFHTSCVPCISLEKHYYYYYYYYYWLKLLRISLLGHLHISQTVDGIRHNQGLWSTCWFFYISRYWYVSSGCSSSISLYFHCWLPTSFILIFKISHFVKIRSLRYVVAEKFYVINQWM
jgi:hypothetical protein